MSFAREMGNVAATLGGGELLRMAWTPKSTGQLFAQGAVSTAVGYGGNLLVSDKSPDEIKEIIRNRAVSMLSSRGIAGEDIQQLFDKHYGDEPLKKVGFARNFGNTITTNMGAEFGSFAMSYLATSNTAVNYGLEYVGKLFGGYVGNKAWQGPSSKVIDERSLDIVTKILTERKPVGAMTQVEALQQRDGQRTQGTEVLR